MEDKKYFIKRVDHKNYFNSDTGCFDSKNTEEWIHKGIKKIISMSSFEICPSLWDDMVYDSKEEAEEDLKKIIKYKGHSFNEFWGSVYSIEEF